MSLENPDRFTAWLIDIDLGILYWVMCICRCYAIITIWAWFKVLCKLLCM